MSQSTGPSLADREIGVRIEQLRADTMLKLLDAIKRDQDFRYAPITLLLTGLGTGAALFGAAIAFLKFVGV